MKVLLINKYLYPRGGDAIATLRTGELLKAHGHKTYLWGMDHPLNPDYPLKKYFVSHIDYNRSQSVYKKAALTLKIFYSAEAKKKLEQVLDEVNPDIVHLNNFAHQISPSILDSLRTRRIPSVMTLHDYKIVCPVYTLLRNGRFCTLCRDKRFFYCTLNKCMKDSFLKSAINSVEMYLHHSLLRIYRDIGCFIAPSELLAKTVGEMGFHRRIEHLPNFIDTSLFPSRNIVGYGNTIVYAGRLSREKGVDTLIEAIRGVEVTCKIFGDGPLREELQKKVAALGLSSRIIFMGYRNSEDLIKETSGALFAVCPSECAENSPLSVIEAFGCGVPVIGSRIGGIPELIEDGVTGFTFTPGDSQELREKLRFLISHADMARQMGLNARDAAQRKYSGNVHYHKLIDIYDRAIELRKSRKSI